MLGYRKRSFERAHHLLRKIATSRPAASSDLLDMHALLIDEIERAERKIRHYKSELRAIDDGNERRKRWLEARVKAYQQLNFVWRCFGDGIAFAFLDKYAIKQAFYQTKSVDPKQSAGFLLDKKGLQGEVATMVTLLSQGVPCVLSDITNSIRYGDVCILAGDEPQFVEVKTTAKLDRRGRRQRDDIAKLHSFYQNDIVKDLRGIPEMRRVAHASSEVVYTAEMNACIAEAMRIGAAVANPEPGLYYLAAKDGRDIGSVMKEWTVKQGALFFLNTFKSQGQWAPYVPFTLTIESTDALFEFIQGNLILVVVHDLERFRRTAERPGMIVKITDDPDQPITYEIDGSDGRGGISGHFLSRVGMEFVSPRWLCEQLAHSIDRMKELAAEKSA